MPKLGFWLFLFMASLLCANPPARAGEVRSVQNGQREVQLFWQPVAEPVGTVLMFSGGGGGFGPVWNGRPGSDNFLVRTMDLWSAKDLNVAYFGDLHADRHSAQHMADIQAVLQWIEAQAPSPIYLVGTSRGTISAAYAAARLSDTRVRGLALTSTMQEVVSTPGLAGLAIPVLDLSHAQDGCSLTPPGAGPAIIEALKASPRKAYIEVSGGSAYGNPCKARAHHGFNGIESVVVDTVANWLLQPESGDGPSR